MQDILLLHGAIGAASQLADIAVLLSGSFKVHTLNFSGHGGKAFSHKPFSIPLFAEEVVAYMDAQGLGTVYIFGYSMGGYVAMYLAKHQPGRISRIITLATKFHWDEATAAKEIQMVNPEKIAAKLPTFAQTLTERHAPLDWKEVLQHTARMLDELGRDNTLKPEDYPTIETKSLILLGDRDKMVSLEETVSVYRLLPNAAMGMLPGTPHPLEQVNAEALLYFITSFLGGDI